MKKSDISSENKRRKLVKLLAAGGVTSTAALQKSWTTPAVNSVLLPAHASGSVPAPGSQFYGTAAFVSNNVDNFAVPDESGSLIAKLGNSFVPAAHAVPETTATIEIAARILDVSGALEYAVKWIEMSPCIGGEGGEGAGGSMSEQSAFGDGESQLGQQINTSLEWCDSGTVPLTITIQLIDNEVFALGSIFGDTDFNVALLGDILFPEPSPCINCLPE